jgi:hypothetical protein
MPPLTSHFCTAIPLSPTASQEASVDEGSLTATLRQFFMDYHAQARPSQDLNTPEEAVSAIDNADKDDPVAKEEERGPTLDKKAPEEMTRKEKAAEKRRKKNIAARNDFKRNDVDFDMSFEDDGTKGGKRANKKPSSKADKTKVKKERKKADTKTKGLSPASLLTAIGEVNSQFSGRRGRSQQDAQELFLTLIDAMDVEEERVRKFGPAEDGTNAADGFATCSSMALTTADDSDDDTIEQLAMDLNSSLHFNEIDVNESSSDDIKVETLVKTLFAGSICSSVKCMHCLKIKRRMEGTMDLSLQIPIDVSKMEKPMNSKRSNSIDMLAASIEGGDDFDMFSGSGTPKEKKKKKKKKEKEARLAAERDAAEKGIVDTGGGALPPAPSASPSSSHFPPPAPKTPENERTAVGLPKIGKPSNSVHEGEPKADPTAGSSPPAEVEVGSGSGEVGLEPESCTEEGPATAEVPDEAKKDQCAKEGDITEAVAEDDAEEGDPMQEPPIFDESSLPSDAQSIFSCLANFTKAEKLQVSDDNGYECDHCSRRDSVVLTKRDATRRMLLHELPTVLVVHFKRLLGFTKIDHFVDFPQKMNLDPFCIQDPDLKQQHTHYELCSVVVHKGTARGGHYSVYVRVPTDMPSESAPASNMEDGSWYYISDNKITKVQEEAVFKAQAYMLYYLAQPCASLKKSDDERYVFV